MKVSNNEEFVSMFKNIFGNCSIEISDNVVEVEEKEKSGKGKIILEFDKSVFKIIPNNKMNIGCIKNPKILDGFILEIDFTSKTVSVYLVELKKNLIGKIFEALEQISRGYWFLNSLSFECFEIEIVIVLGYKEKLNEQNLVFLLEGEKNILKKAVYNSLLNYIKGKEKKFPIKLPFCKFKYYKLILKEMI